MTDSVEGGHKIWGGDLYASAAAFCCLLLMWNVIEGTRGCVMGLMRAFRPNEARSGSFR